MCSRKRHLRTKGVDEKSLFFPEYISLARRKGKMKTFFINKVKYSFDDFQSLKPFGNLRVTLHWLCGILAIILLSPLLYTTPLTIQILDQNHAPIPFVAVQTETQTVTTDENGKIIINLNDNDFMFQRIGYKHIKRTAEQLKQSPTVIMQSTPIEAADVTVKTNPVHQPFRISSETHRIEVSELNRTYSTVEDLIKDIQSINVKGVRLAGEKQIISLGGHQGKHTIIMLDNVVLNPSGQAVDLSSIPMSQIEAVEIVKNNVSVDTGAGGLAGMVVLHTKRANRINQVHVSQSIGSFSSYKQNYGFHLFHNNFAVRANVSHIQAKNDFEYEYREEIQKRENNSVAMLNLSTELQYVLKKHLFIYSLHYQDFKKMLPGTVNAANRFLGSYQEGASFHNNLQYSTNFNLFESPMSFDTQIFYIDNKSEYNNTVAPSKIYYAIDKNYQTLSGGKIGITQDFILGIFDLTSVIGSDFKKETFKLDDLYTPNGRNSIDLITQSTFALYGSQAISKDFYYWTPVFKGSVRVDDNDISDTFTNWRAEFNNTFHTQIPFQIKSSIGTSYSLPSFYDLYWKGDSQVSGNPDLLPEKSFGWRIDASTNTNPMLGVARWNNKTENLIFWVRALQGWRPYNLANAELDNWEIWGQYDFLKQQNIKFNYTRTIAKNKSLNENGSQGGAYNKLIPYTPAWHWDVQLNTRMGRYSQSIIYMAQGAQWSTIDQLMDNSRIKGYEVWNTRTGVDFNIWRIDSNLNLSVYNIFDKRFENYHYIPEPGRHWELQINFKI